MPHCASKPSCPNRCKCGEQVKAEYEKTHEEKAGR